MKLKNHSDHFEIIGVAEYALIDCVLVMLFWNFCGIYNKMHVEILYSTCKMLIGLQMTHFKSAVAASIHLTSSKFVKARYILVSPPLKSFSISILLWVQRSLLWI